MLTEWKKNLISEWLFEQAQKYLSDEQTTCFLETILVFVDLLIELDRTVLAEMLMEKYDR